MAVRPTEWESVYTDGPWLLTKNLVPGVSVYGEGRPIEGGVEYRRWDANRSKLAAYLKVGGRVWPFRSEASVLYLGAGSGTTVSHLSDICRTGLITAVEMSARSFRDLLGLAERRPNLVPVMADASKPETYAGRVGTVDVLYQDVAQRDQATIFLKNVESLRVGGIGYLMVKARSEDVTAAPRRIFDGAKTELADAGMKILDLRVLTPHQADHAALAVQKQ
ncbi:MAG TPA: fibrillarin-like rRNA/tRNA 2'-O-methyltransferase [Thermoplasmata archaeon]|nr:fibrillarin-like rRNA/tRNA 2'-O-methyltransferase [Thermoplasmata archaeon]